MPQITGNFNYLITSIVLQLFIFFFPKTTTRNNNNNIYIYILLLASKSFSKKCFTLVPKKNNETKRKSIHLGLLIADF